MSREFSYAHHPGSGGGDVLPRRPILLLGVALTILVGLMADLGWRAYTRPQYFVTVNGVQVGTLRVSHRFFATAQGEAQSAAVTATPNVTDKVAVKPSGLRLPIAADSGRSAQPSKAQVVPSDVPGAVISVNGQEIVAVADEQTAQSVRDQILDEYRNTILKDAAAIEQVMFQETISWGTKSVSRESIRTAEEAINILKLGTDKLVTYVVKSGDTGWDIARSYNVSTEQLAKANPLTNLERLQIGQVLNVTFKEPYVHTQSVSKRVVKEGIPFTEQIQQDPALWPWQYEIVRAGVYGQRQLTIREYREDGRVVKNEVIENVVLSQPVPQIVRQGTKQIPAMGTGSLVYPVVGVTTSMYGPRWGGYHNGIDIAASTGTPILAADSGMVVFRGWSGNYGYLIKIDHGNGAMVTWYGHLSRFNVSLGDTVTKGQVIGYVGNTGFSTGPHLHYEVHVNGKPVDPLRYYR